MLCNATQIRQVVMNFAINASQAIGARDGVIYVRTSRAKGARFGYNCCRDPRRITFGWRSPIPVAA